MSIIKALKVLDFNIIEKMINHFQPDSNFKFIDYTDPNDICIHRSWFLYKNHKSSFTSGELNELLAENCDLKYGVGREINGLIADLIIHACNDK